MMRAHGLSLLLIAAIGCLPSVPVQPSDAGARERDAAGDAGVAPSDGPPAGDANTPADAMPTADAGAEDATIADAAPNPDAAAADAAPTDSGLVPLPQVIGDCDVRWTPVLHDTFDPLDRAPAGAVTAGTTVRLRIRTGAADVTGVRLEVYDARTRTTTAIPMLRAATGLIGANAYDWWIADVRTAQPTLLYYDFELDDAGDQGRCPAARAPDQDYYVDDEPSFYGGGTGAMSDAPDTGRRFQISVYDPAFAVPSWFQRGLVYQIFPDRFRNGDPSNDHPAGSFNYNRPPSILRSNQTRWNAKICDPLGSDAPACVGIRTQNYYGGDLAGIRQKIDDGYFDLIGVTVLYLNPIFRSGSNHKYDTQDYFTIEPDLGTEADFIALAAAARQHGIRLVLDGVFNHMSSDSAAFDRYSRWNAAGILTSPSGPGTNDASGACESAASPYRSWFTFPGVANPARENGALVLCQGESYETWNGGPHLPKLNGATAGVRGLVWSNGLASVGPHWIQRGASGWRFDVGGAVDPGLTRDPQNDYWEGFRAAVRDAAVTGQSDVVMIGEEWGDASPWLLGNEWDSVMNYRFRSAMLSWLFTGCTGQGCTNGTTLVDGDDNIGSSSGAMQALRPSQLDLRLRAIAEDYPKPAFLAMMNLADSHDTNRIRYLLKRGNRDDDGAAVQRMKELWLLSYTYPGAPTLYYGDEIGLTHDAVWDGTTLQDDPYNRAPFPWDDTPGDYAADTTNLLPHLRRMASLRLGYRALQDGEVIHGMIVDDAAHLYGYGRRAADGSLALIALNRDAAGHTASFRGLDQLGIADGAAFTDAISGRAVTVAQGALSIDVSSNWGVVLLQPGAVDQPAPATDLRSTTDGADQLLSFPPVTVDTHGERELVVRYELHKSAQPGFTPDASNRIAVMTPPPFGAPGGRLSIRDPGAAGGAANYVLRAFNAAGAYSETRF